MATSTMKEFFRLMRDINKFTDGQAEVYLDDDENENNCKAEDDQTEDENDDSCFTFYLVIKPNDGYYKGGRIKFKVDLDDYPTGPPCVTCCNVIYHPNIDLTEDENYGSVCVNLLGSDWTPEVGLDGCVMAVLFLFYNPQLDDALSTVFSGSNEEDELETFAENVQISMWGGEIDGYTFDNIMSDECDREKQNGAENTKVSTPEEVLDANGNGTSVKEGENEAENEKKMDECENGEEFKKTDSLEPIKDDANTDTDGCVPNSVDVEGISNIVKDSDAPSTITDVANAIDETSYEHQNDPLIVPCEVVGNTIIDNCSTGNENVASSFVQTKTELVLNVQGVEKDHEKSEHRQTIMKYIKTKLNVFSGVFKLINQCKGILPRR